MQCVELLTYCHTSTCFSAYLGKADAKEEKTYPAPNAFQGNRTYDPVCTCQAAAKEAKSSITRVHHCYFSPQVNRECLSDLRIKVRYSFIYTEHLLIS